MGGAIQATSGDEPTLTLFEGSHGVVSMTTGCNGPGITAWAKNPRISGSRAELFVDRTTHHPVLRLHGANDLDRAVLAGDDDGSALELRDDRGIVRVKVVAVRKGGRIEFFDEDGRLVAQFPSR